MGKFPKAVRDEAVKLAKEGMHLKVIQRTLCNGKGPNPKATMRYLKRQGIDYHQLVIELKEQGKAPKTLVKLSKEKEKARKERRKLEIKPVEESYEDVFQ